MGKIKIAISGIGAVGGFYGGLIAKKYEKSDFIETFFISRGENLEAIRRNGLQVKTKYRSFCARPSLATDNPEEIGTVDYLFCCTKSYDLEDNIRQLAPVIGKDTVVIPLLNGIDIAERIQILLPETEIWKGCVYISARLTRPGMVEKFSFKDQLSFGSETAGKERQSELLRILYDAHVCAFNPSDINSRIWEKFFMISVAGTISSFYNKPVREALKYHADMFISLGYELQRVAEAKGVKLPDNIVMENLEQQKMMPENSTTSMHDDFRNKHKTELETLTGSVLRMGRESGVETPAYQFLYNGLNDFNYPPAQE